MPNLFKNTVDAILADFHKVVTRLEELADLELNKAEALGKSIEEMAKEKEAKIAHAAKASSVALKIKALLDA